MDSPYILNAGQIFTFFFIMLGPLRFKDAYSKVLLNFDESERSKLAWKIGAITTLTLVIGGYVGSMLLIKWKISHPVLLLAAGILFFVAIFKHLFSTKPEYEELYIEKPNAIDIALHLILSQYGLAVVILLMSFSHDNSRILTILMCLFAVMILNILTMIFSKATQKKSALRIFEPIIGTLQFALSIQMIVIGVNMIGVNVI
jgi:multiple antibiotic resistance protein